MIWSILTAIFSPNYSPIHQPQSWVSHETPATSVRPPVLRELTTARRGMDIFPGNTLDEEKKIKKERQRIEE